MKQIRVHFLIYSWNENSIPQINNQQNIHNQEKQLREKKSYFNYLQNYTGIRSGVHYNSIALQGSQTESQLEFLFLAIFRNPVFNVAIPSKAKGSVAWNNHFQKTHVLLSTYEVIPQLLS